MQKTAFLFLSIALIAFGYCLTSIGIAEQAEPMLQLVFQKNNDICIVSIDDHKPICLTQTSTIEERNPLFSPDGRFLTYQATEKTGAAETFATYLYNMETEATTRLPKAWRIYDWSPDSRYLLTTQVDDNLRDIAIVRPDGSNFQILTDGQNVYSQPAWSPDGTQIAFLSGHPEATLTIMSATGEVLQMLTVDLNVNLEVQPQWSPDGQTIAFVVNGEYIGSDRTSEIYTIRADGTELLQLTDIGGATLDPRWSPDGTQLVFYSYQSGAFDSENSADPENFRTEVFRINADGTDLVNLTRNTGLDSQPAWSPDGEWIAFGSNRIWEDEPRPGIFIMHPDGSNLQMITDELPFSEGGDSVTSPMWRPIPKD